MKEKIVLYFKNINCIHLGLLMTLVVSYFIFVDSFKFQVWQAGQHWVSDVPGHTEILIKFAKEGAFPVYTLWFRIVNIFSGFSLNYNKLAFTSIFLLTALIGIKYLLNYWILRKNAKNIKLAALVSLALIFAMPLLTYERYIDQMMVSNFHVYLGNISPNQWHNSTLILAMPFNLLLFYYSLEYINSDKLFDFLKMGMLVFLSILCKPNYALAFLPVFCTYLFFINIRSRQFLRAFLKTGLIAIPAIAVLIYQWYFTFVENNAFEHPLGTVIAPFLVWRTYSPHVFLSFVLSSAFPLVLLFCYYKKTDRFVVMSWLIYLVALAMFALLAEYPGYSSGNYGWGAIAANNLLFLFSARNLISQPIDLKAKISYAVLTLHVLSGFYLLGSFFIAKTSLIL